MEIRQNPRDNLGLHPRKIYFFVYYINIYKTSCRNLQRFSRSLRGTGTGTNQPRPEPTGTDRSRPAPDRPQLAWTGTSLGPVCAGPYRVSNGLYRSM